MTDLDAIRYMTNTTDSPEAQACHMLADAVSALQARVAELEEANANLLSSGGAIDVALRNRDDVYLNHISKAEERLYARIFTLVAASKPAEAPAPVMVTLNKAAFDEAIAELREAWEESFGMPTATNKRIDMALRLLTGD